MSLLLIFGQAVPEIFEFQYSKKGVFLNKISRELTRMAPNRKFLMVFFAIFWE